MVGNSSPDRLDQRDDAESFLRRETRRRASQMKQPMREYMQDYRDRREPKRVWRRIVIKFLGPSKSWRVRKSRRNGLRGNVIRRGGAPSYGVKQEQGTHPFMSLQLTWILVSAA